MWFFDPPRRIEDAVYDRIATDVQTIDLDSDPALKRAVQDSIAGRTTVAPEPETKRTRSAYQLPPRVTKGFVQVEVEVDATGRVTAARVLGAVPAGVYEQQALDQVRARRFVPPTAEGKPVAGKLTEVIPFQVEAPGR
jgi:TonB family protein